jgi:hypothetical protein
MNGQVSKYFKSKYELAMRYTLVEPDAEVAQLRKRTEEALLGCTRYLNGHRIKLQAYTGYRWLEANPSLDGAGNSWTLLFQVEFGI